jgi:hypothetical protein
MTDEEKYAKIAELVTAAEPHRNAEKREAWRQIVGIVNDDEVAPRVEEVPEPEAVEPPARRTRTPKD